MKNNPYKNLPPLERRPDGSLYRMTPAQRKQAASSDILIGVAKEFKVSTDYILGLSTVSVRKSYDISELGLSEGAVSWL